MPTAQKMMPEAEVTLRLAFWFLEHAESGAHADVAIDGAHVRIKAHLHAGRAVGERIVFNIKSFLTDSGWSIDSLRDEWRGRYVRSGRTLSIRSARGFDVQIESGGREIRAECKGGPLESVPGQSAAYILAGAVGQAICAATDSATEQLWVAVPDSPSFEQAALRISEKRAFRNTGIGIALVSSGRVRMLHRPR